MKKQILLSIPIIATVGVSCSNQSQKLEKKPNVIFIYADDIGYGDLGCNGATEIKTPNVDKLASEGIRFTNAHCAAATSTPSRYALLTGEYAWRRKGTGIAAGNAAMVITPDRYTIADMFQSAGYTTGVVGKWHLGLGAVTGEQDWNGLVTPNPTDIGFDYSYIMAATGDRVPCVWIQNGRAVGVSTEDPIEVSYSKNFDDEPTGRNNPEMLRVHPSHGHDMSIVNGISRIGYMRGGESALWRDQDIQINIIDKAIGFIEEKSKKDEPFFLYLATNDIHVPRDPNERFIGKSGMGPRGDALLSFDWGVGEVMATLERLGLDENTIVVLSSDNGPVIDDGYEDQAVELLGNHTPSGIYRGGKYSIFEAGTRVPCIVRWKGEVESGVSNNLMSQIDLFSSFATMLGEAIPEGAALDSESHLNSWLNKDKKGRELLVEQNVNNNLAITDGEWKFIPASKGHAMIKETNTELGNSSEPQLYNLNSDPSERNNIYESETIEAQRLQSELTKIIEKHGYLK